MKVKELVNKLNAEFSKDETVSYASIKKLFAKDSVKHKIAELFALGMNWEQIAEEANISRSTVALKVTELKKDNDAVNNIDLVRKLILGGAVGIKYKNIHLDLHEISFLQALSIFPTLDAVCKETTFSRDIAYKKINNLKAKLKLNSKSELVSYFMHNKERLVK